MPKIAIEANELSQVQVSHISLVKRGANKVPFRMLKSDGGTEMIQFDMKRVFKSQPKTPMVAAILVSKDADLDATKARITKAGFSVEKQTDSDDGVIFAQSDDKEIKGIILKMDADVALVLTNVEKAFEPMNLESTSFGEVFAQEGLVPGFRLAVEALQDTFFNVLAKAENPEDLTKDVTRVIGEFSTHMNLLAKAVPPDAFSLDFFKAEAEPVKKTEGESDEDKATREAKEKDEADAAAKLEADAEAAKAKKIEEAGDDPVALAAIASQETADANQAVLLKAITDMGTETQKQIGALGERITSVEAQSNETKNALSKTAAGVVHTNDDDPTKTVSKSDEHRDPPLIDTAYDRSLSKKAGKESESLH